MRQFGQVKGDLIIKADKVRIVFSGEVDYKQLATSSVITVIREKNYWNWCANKSKDRQK